MRRRLAPGLVAGVALWGILTVACSSAVDGPAPGGARWSGAIDSPDLPGPQGPPLAVAWDDEARTDTLYRVSPRTMKLRGPVPLNARGTMGTDVSPDGSLLLTNFRGRVQVVDLREMRPVSRFAADVRGVREVAWVDDDVAILLASGRTKARLVRVEPSTGTVLDVETIAGRYFTSADTGDGVVVLVHHLPQEPSKAPGPVTLAVMDAAGEFAAVRLDDIGAGVFSGPAGEATTQAMPALAVRDSRATVVGTDGTIVSVDLNTLDVTVEGENRSLLAAIAGWFVPPAHAKVFDGTVLSAEWAGPDALLVSGYSTEDLETRPAGAVLLDPDDWSATVVDEDAYFAHVARDHLLTWKYIMPGDDLGEGIGVRSYTPEGELEWGVFDGQFARLIATHRGVAFVEHGRNRVLVSSVDLDTGKVLASRFSYVRVLPP
ncbi:MAG TPA: hypothetical protein VHN37_00150 [Actinomycetota bacterium]|nr:hypothetical protein [Actinomycetota bacterium]